MSKEIRIFIASSNDLEAERKDLKLLIHDEGFTPVVWETIDQSITEKKFQDRINDEHLIKSDIVIFMVKTKIGKYTIEEFKEAYENLGKSIGNIYIYFFDVDKNDVDKKELRKILSLQEYLEDKGDKYEEIQEFNELKSHFLEQKKYFTRSLEIEDEVEEKDTVVQKVQAVPKICIYTASPLNNKINNSISSIIRLFKKYKVKVCHNILNENELLEFRDFDYNLIFTKTNKQKIIIEDEYFMQKSITLDRLEELVDKDKVTLFLDDVIENTQFNIKKNINKEIVSFLFDNFKNIKGQCQVNTLKSELPNEIDVTTFNNFVGRETDIEIIIRKILTIKDEHRILTIKGAGGLGKTTLISKVASEVAQRGKYKDGIEFVRCEYIKDYEDFENKITFAFNMGNALDFKEQLKKLYTDEDKLIILDNIETLLNLDDTKKIKDFIRFISNYATIVTTSREKLNESDYEEVYDLKEFSTDEAEILFKKLYKIKSYDKTQFRSEVLENLLSNNPLAITLVANNLSKHKTTKQIKKELDDNFISMTTKDLEEIFDRDSDNNIQRLGSLFSSINYSYIKLTDKEKLALELLSLFPDGMHFENFKEFYNQKVDKKITDKDKRNEKIQEISTIKSENFSDKDLKSLEDKSLIVNNNQLINLQSIIGRFANYKFNSRDKNEKINFYNKVYIYNSYLLKLVDDISISNSVRARIFDDNKNNFLKCLDNMQYLELDFNKYDFIDDLRGEFIFSSPSKKIFKKLIKLKNLISNKKIKQNFFDIQLLSLKYFYYDFNSVYTLICEEFPLIKVMKDYKISDEIRLLNNNTLLNIYDMEGNQFEYVKLSMSKGIFNTSTFDIGEHKIFKKYLKVYHLDNEFSKFEFQLCMQSLNIKEIKKYISLLYKTQIIEKIQSTYTLLKADKSEVKLKYIKKLVITNPFTDGLQTLMLAIKDTENCSKAMYKDAIKKLYHIKYYHVEAILKYCEYLNDTNDDDYKKWLKEGKGLAQKHYYRYLLHQFICLDSGIYTDYNEEDYPLPEQLDYSEIIKNYDLKA